MLNFLDYLAEATTEYPGNLRVPQKLLSDITKWYVDIFLKVILQSAIENLNHERVKVKNAQKNAQHEAPVDMEDIESTVRHELYGSGASKEEYEDLKNYYIDMRKKEFKQNYIHAARRYNDLLDLKKYLRNELRVRRDMNIDDVLHDAEFTGKKFNIDVNDFMDIIQKLERSGRKINYNNLGDHVYCIISSGVRAKNLGYGGLYEPLNNVIDIPITKALNVKSLQDLFVFLNYIKESIKHELIHALQWNIYHTLKITRRDDKPLPDFASKLSPELQQKLYFSSKSEYPAQLIDAVADFRQQIEKNMRYDKNFKLTNDIIRYYTDQTDSLPDSEISFEKHPLFISMKKYQPEYYRQTVNNFIKLLNKESTVPKKMSYGSSVFTPLIDIKSLIKKD